MKTTKKNKITIGIVGVVVITVLVVNDLFFFGGNMLFYAKWVECGRRPLEGVGGWAGVPHYYEGAVFAPLRSKNLFCTPLEAEQAGYSANEDRWDQPHLEEFRQQQNE